MRRALLLAVLSAGPAAAQPPAQLWDVELDVTDAFDNTQRSAAGHIHTYHFAHATLVLDLESPLPVAGRLRLATRRAHLASLAGRIDGGRAASTPTSEARLDYQATVLADQLALEVSCDAPTSWAVAFRIGLATRGTNTACVVRGRHRTCADAEVAPLGPLGWTIDARRGGRMYRDGDTWHITYAQDDGRCAAGDTHHHRELTITLRPRLPSMVMLGRVQR